MEKIQFKYFRGNEVDQYSFYRIPKVLFRNNYFKNLSCEAKVLYGLLLDRTSLSIRNRWLDEEDRVYIIFTIEEVSEMLNCGVQKAVKLLKELDCRTGIGLIEKKRLGLGKPNIIYVKNFMTEDLDSSSYTKKEQNCEKRNLRISEKEVQEDVKQRIRVSFILAADCVKPIASALEAISFARGSACSNSDPVSGLSMEIYS